VVQLDRDIARASYDIDGFAVHPRGITGSGEIRLRSADLARVFGRGDIHLRTDDGRLLDLRFSDRTLREDAVVAHVDVGGDLPTSATAWRGRVAPSAHAITPAPAKSRGR
jgi:hypothetical protein